MADTAATFKDAAGNSVTHDARTNVAGTEIRPTITIGNDGDVVAGVEPFGALNVNAGYTTMFYDSWGAALDTTDKWTVVGNAPSITGGNMVMSATLSSYNAIRTKDVIRPTSGFAYVANGITLETTAATGAGRFWGLGTQAVTPAAAVLVQDGVGFEIDQATGALLAVTYNAGVRTTVATLTRPTDGAIHRYALYFRVTGATWYIDNLQVPVASVNFPNVGVVELPAITVRQNAAAFTGTPVFTSIAHLTADTTPQGRSIVDPVIGTRQARVRSTGALDVNIAGTAGSITSSTGTLSALSATATTQVANSTSGIVADVTSAGNVTVVAVTTGTSNATLVFEASIDTAGTAATWFPIDATRSDGSAVETRALITGTTAQAWNIMAPGYRWIRVRLMSATTIGTIAATIVPGPMLYDPSPSVTQNPLAALQGPSLTTAFVPGSVSTPAYVTGTAIVATTTALVGAPGAGLSIYVTDMEGSNEGAAGTRISLLEGTTVKYARWMAASGGGFANNLRTPWKLPANTALNYGSSVATTFHLTVNFYVAP